MKKILMSILTIGIAAGMIGLGTLANYSDTETSTGNTFTAGTLDLKVGGQDDLNVVHFELSNLAPGWSHTYKWTLKNAGSVDGVVTICFSHVVELENGTNEPEEAAENFVFTPAGCPPQTVGISDTGELGYFLRAVQSRVSPPNMHTRYQYTSLFLYPYSHLHMPNLCVS